MRFFIRLFFRKSALLTLLFFSLLFINLTNVRSEDLVLSLPEAISEIQKIQAEIQKNKLLLQQCLNSLAQLKDSKEKNNLIVEITKLITKLNDLTKSELMVSQGHVEAAQIISGFEAAGMNVDEAIGNLLSSLQNEYDKLSRLKTTLTREFSEMESRLVNLREGTKPWVELKSALTSKLIEKEGVHEQLQLLLQKKNDLETYSRLTDSESRANLLKSFLRHATKSFDRLKSDLAQVVRNINENIMNWARGLCARCGKGLSVGAMANPNYPTGNLPFCVKPFPDPDSRKALQLFKDLVGGKVRELEPLFVETGHIGPISGKLGPMINELEDLVNSGHKVTGLIQDAIDIVNKISEDDLALNNVKKAISKFYKDASAFSKTKCVPPGSVGAMANPNCPKGKIDPKLLEFEKGKNPLQNLESKLKGLFDIASKERQVFPVIIRIGNVVVGALKVIGRVLNGVVIIEELSVVADPTGGLTQSLSWANPLLILPGIPELIGLGQLECVRSLREFIETPGPLSILCKLSDQAERYKNNNYCPEIKSTDSLIKYLEDCERYAMFGIPKVCKISRSFFSSLKEYKGDLVNKEVYFAMNNEESVAKMKGVLNDLRDLLVRYKNKNKVDCSPKPVPPVPDYDPGFHPSW